MPNNRWTRLLQVALFIPKVCLIFLALPAWYVVTGEVPDPDEYFGWPVDGDGY